MRWPAAPSREREGDAETEGEMGSGMELMSR